MGKRGVFFLIVILLISIISAEKLEINTKNSHYPGDEVIFKVNLYDNQNNRIPGEINYQILNYYSEYIEQGIINSGEEKKFVLPNNAIRGHWSIIAKYLNLEEKILFNVLELEKVDIILEDDKLIITNIGNVPYRKSIQIEIGKHKETALVPLGIGETKIIRLTAPEGKYNIKVNDGSEENVFQEVSLTGNVIGLEDTDNNFLKKYPLIILFFVIIIIAIIISAFKFFIKKSNHKNKNFKNAKLR